MQVATDSVKDLNDNKIRAIACKIVENLVQRSIDRSGWNERWECEKYFVRYLVDDVVEEIFSFTPLDVDASVFMAAGFMSQLCEEWEIEDLSQIVDEIAHGYMGAVDYLVRYKHKLPKLIKTSELPNYSFGPIKTLAKGKSAPIDAFTEVTWWMMVCAMVRLSCDLPAGGNCLIIRDLIATPDVFHQLGEKISEEQLTMMMQNPGRARLRVAEMETIMVH